MAALTQFHLPSLGSEPREAPGGSRDSGFWSLRQVAVVLGIGLLAWAVVLVPILLWH